MPAPVVLKVSLPLFGFGSRGAGLCWLLVPGAVRGAERSSSASLPPLAARTRTASLSLTELGGVFSAASLSSLLQHTSTQQQASKQIFFLKS